MNRRFRVGWLSAVVMLLSILTGGVLLPVANAAPVATGPVDTATVDRFVEGQMNRHGIPGLVLALVEDGRVTYAQGYGHAGVGRPDRGSADADRIGHQNVHAVAVLQLVEQGRIDLDAPVRTYLPWFRGHRDPGGEHQGGRHMVATPPSWRPINPIKPPKTKAQQCRESATADPRGQKPTLVHGARMPPLGVRSSLCC